MKRPEGGEKGGHSGKAEILKTEILKVGGGRGSGWSPRSIADGGAEGGVFGGAGGLRGDGAGDGGAREDQIECCDAWAGWLGRDGARGWGTRIGREDRTGMAKKGRQNAYYVVMKDCGGD